MDDTQHPGPEAVDVASSDTPGSRAGASSDEIESALSALAAADAADAPTLAERLAAELSDELETRQPPPGHDEEGRS